MGIASPDRVVAASRLMREFARETGLEGDRPPRRYLWTDAFAVCNALSLHDALGEKHWLDLALRLVDQVHHVLGRHRPDDPRSGWISGLSEAEGELHPTAGGLRIGKPLNERQPGAHPDPRLEWEQDGQYFHYLTQWMHALSSVAAATGDARYHVWAVELARTAHRAFRTVSAAGDRRLVWKMSIDLTRPLVDSSGHHDPLDGLVTYATLASAAGASEEGSPTVLAGELAELHEMCAEKDWGTSDALGIGGLLIAAYRAARLRAHGDAIISTDLVGGALVDAARSLRAFRRSEALDAPPSYRLAFRELGLGIGLHAAARLPLMSAPVSREVVAELAGHADLRQRIEETWLSPEARRAPVWSEHADINTVMLATCLLPDAYLG